MNDKLENRTRRGERTSLRIALVALTTLVASAGCANQTPVTPLLRVDPNAASRFMYFEKRAASMLKEHGVGVEQAEDVDESVDDEAVAHAGESPPPLRTWGAPSDAESVESGAPSPAAAPSPSELPKQKDLAIP